MEVLGIDIGGSAIKAAIIDTKKEEIVGEILRILTPPKKKPEDIILVLKQITTHFKWTGKIGCGFPAPIKDGVIQTIENFHKDWIGINVEEYFSEKIKCNFTVLNDADVAALAQLKQSKKKKGTSIFITIGTGIGTALFFDGKLIPNTELGCIEMNGMIAERYAAGSIRKKENLSIDIWAKRFNEYLLLLEKLFYPNCFILGGGISEKFDEYSKHFTTKAIVEPAKLLNESGIIGAAIAVLV